MSYQFEWDPKKAKSNLIKHAVSFDEAKTVFEDNLAKIFDDEMHSINELREIIIGNSVAHRLIVVGFTERKKGVLRIITAREATKKERKDYEENIYF